MARLGNPISLQSSGPRVRPREFIYSVLDAARSPEVLAHLRQLDQGWACLYRGELADSLGDVAPYLVQLDPAGKALAWVIEKGIGDSWGIILSSPAPFEALHHHFRKFLLVRDEEGRKLYFRFYDPRVLRVFLPSCTPEEAKEFFGPISRFFLEESGGGICAFSLRSSGHLQLEKLNESKQELGKYFSSLAIGRKTRLSGYQK
jgi:hypothetical protein